MICLSKSSIFHQMFCMHGVLWWRAKSNGVRLKDINSPCRLPHCTAEANHILRHFYRLPRYRLAEFYRHLNHTLYRFRSPPKKKTTTALQIGTPNRRSLTENPALQMAPNVGLII